MRRSFNFHQAARRCPISAKMVRPREVKVYGALRLLFGLLNQFLSFQILNEGIGRLMGKRKVSLIALMRIAPAFEMVVRTARTRSD